MTDVAATAPALAALQAQVNQLDLAALASAGKPG